MATTKPMTVKKAIRTAKLEVKLGNFDAAHQLYTAVLHHQPNHPVALKGLRKLQKIQPDKSAAPAGPTDPGIDQLNELINLYHAGKIQQTEKGCKALLKDYPESITLLNLLGAAQSGLGQLEAAVESYDQAIRINPRYAEAYNNRGVALRDLGKTTAALDDYAKATQLDPDHAEAHNNIGVALSDLKQPERALKSYGHAIRLKPGYAQAYYNRGNAYKALGKFDAALENYEKAIRLQPDDAAPYVNQGIVHSSLGQLKKAIESYDQAIRINPRYAEAYNNRGVALKDIGRLEEALKDYDNAIQINAAYAEAHNNRGVALQDLNRMTDAARSYARSLQLNPDNPDARRNVALLLKNHPLQPILEDRTFYYQLLKKLYLCHDINHDDIFKTAIFVLISPEHFHRIEALLNSKTSIFATPIIQLLIEEPLFALMLQKSIISDNVIEKMLTKLRQEILFLFDSEKNNELKKYFSFIISLSAQCFLNEYIFNQTDNEAEIISRQISEQAVSREIDELGVAVISCYTALHTMNPVSEKLLDYQSKNNLFNDLICLQITEPIREKQLAGSITSLHEISDDTSRKVKRQYEQYPYPRWRHTYSSQPIDAMQLINSEIKPNILDFHENFLCPEVLIAGCGTGRQALAANDYKNAKITGVDLSLASLSYAKRKTEELHMKNIEYLQADILQLGELNKEFDIIESIGVLHHMCHPLQGLQILTRLLAPHGLLKLGLYSQLARQPVADARAFIRKNRFTGTTPHDIRRCRQAIRDEKGNHSLKKISSSKDFFSVSTVKDLIFNVQEHHFTIVQISKILTDLKLEFSGFIGLSPQIRKRYAQSFQHDETQTDLNSWHEFETGNPETFEGMYQFIVRKIQRGT